MGIISRAERTDIRILGKLTVDGGAEPVTYLCNTINLSLSGAFVETSSVIPVGSVLRYTFSIPGAGTPFDLAGEIIRKATAGSDAAAHVPDNARYDAEQGSGAERSLNCYGIRFLDIGEKDRAVLARLLKK